MKMLTTIFAAMLLMTACGETDDLTGMSPPLSLTGEWRQVNAGDTYQAATITVDTIEIYWVSPDSKALYWAGSMPEKLDCATPYDAQFKSIADKSKTANAMLASQDDSKFFFFADGVIQYEVSMMGITSKIKLERIAE